MSHQSSPEWRGRLIRYAPVLFWIGVIFFLSSGAGAMSETSRYIRPLLEFLFPSADADTLQLYHGYIRKIAHPVEYAMLAFLASRALLSSRVRPLRRHWYAYAMLLVVVIASADEIGQSFDPSRTGSAADVLIDAAGGAFIVALIAISMRLRSMRYILGISGGQDGQLSGHSSEPNGDLPA